MTTVKPLALLTVLLVAGAAQAQDLGAPVGPPILRFSFSNPGARSMGLGGAFVALADDATAAFANPAGLVQIVRPEISVEGRSWSYTTPFSEQGRIEGEPTGFGVDVIDGVASGTSSFDASDVSFVSFVYPHKKWSVAFYRHLLANFESLTATRGFFAGSDTTCCRFADYRTRTDLEIVSYAVGGSLRVSDTLGIGLSVVRFEAELDIAGEVFLPDPPIGDELVIFTPTSYLPERELGQTDIVMDDGDWGLNAGFLWAASPRWRFGGFYRGGPRFDSIAETRTGPASWYLDLPPAGTVINSTTTPLAFPDVYGLGTAYRPGDGRLTLSFEWDRVEYSTILSSLGEDIDVSTLSLSDADELRLGGEYVFVRSSPIVALRLGAWLDPDHQSHFTRRADLIEQALLPPGDNEIHLAVGVGLAFDRFQLDFGADLSDHVDSASVSAIYSF